ncbi:MFS transporter [Kitasatospora sp. A2-31]|uniref:MFS transporter n=1 Tax=Kitasatospora sp. A2-31 TaxID=2916414 RepID=UPI001EED1A70|nr:MFS transporter [Kitasatospora sp. A2-31]MCG6499498.1 MFS transporter [Kitasatospora sp. A2-31]
MTTTATPPRAAGLLGRLTATLLPASRQGRIMAAGTTVDAVANGLYLATATLYFVRYLDITAVAVGTAIAAANIVGLLSPLVFGPLADRLGARPVYVALTLVRGAGFIGYALVGSYAGYLVVTCLIIAAARACSPLLQVIVGEFEGAAERTRTMASLRAITNIGLTAGFLLAALVQAAHSRAAFVALFLFNAVAFAAVALAVVRAGRVAGGAEAPGGDAAAPAAEANAGAGGDGSPYRDRRFLLVTAANAVLMLHDCVLFILLPLWVVERAGLPASASSGLLAVNTVLTVVLQLSVARLAQGLAKALRMLRTACLFLVLACAFFAFADGRGRGLALAAAVVAVVLLTVGENLHAISRWEISYELSPPAGRSRYLSLFSTGMSAQLIVGPFLATGVLLPAGAGGWILLAALFAGATAVTVLAARTPAGPEDTPTEALTG